MKRRHFRLVLPLLVLLSPTARRASAKPPDTQSAALPSPARTEAQRPIEIKPTAEATAAAVVEKQLVKPLVEKEERRNRFSRSYIPPLARRVRMLDHERSTDGRGAEFAAFAVDERSGRFARRAADDSSWRKDAIVGCVYPARDEIFIKRGDKFFGAALLLGKKTAAADDTVCRPALARIDPSRPTLASTSQVVAGPVARKR
jgi:hypothetical protein